MGQTAVYQQRWVRLQGAEGVNGINRICWSHLCAWGGVSLPCQGFVACTAPHWMQELMHWPRPQPCGGTVQAHWGCPAAPAPSYTNREQSHFICFLPDAAGTSFFFREHWLMVTVTYLSFSDSSSFLTVDKKRPSVTLGDIRCHDGHQCHMFCVYHNTEY